LPSSAPLRVSVTRKKSLRGHHENQGGHRGATGGKGATYVYNMHLEIFS